MAVTLGSSGITFSDGSVQTTASLGTGASTDTGDLINIQSFTSSGTWTKPAGGIMAHIKLVGGGGGSAGYCESGGAGGYLEMRLDVTNISTVAVTIGGGGGGVGYYAAAGDGGSTSFGSYLIALGGYGANRNYSHSGGHGGHNVSGGTIAVTGGAGCGHVNSVGHWSGGRGGQSYFGSSATIVRNHTNISASTRGPQGTPGAPGSGAPGNQTDAGWWFNEGYTGSPGLCIVYTYS